MRFESSRRRRRRRQKEGGKRGDEARFFVQWCLLKSLKSVSEKRRQRPGCVGKGHRRRVEMPTELASNCAKFVQLWMARLFSQLQWLKEVGRS